MDPSPSIAARVGQLLSLSREQLAQIVIEKEFQLNPSQALQYVSDSSSQQPNLQTKQTNQTNQTNQTKPQLNQVSTPSGSTEPSNPALVKLEEDKKRELGDLTNPAKKQAPELIPTNRREPRGKKLESRRGESSTGTSAATATFF